MKNMRLFIPCRSRSREIVKWSVILACAVAFCSVSVMAVPPCVEWQNVAFAPRVAHAMAYDIERGVTVLFGGGYGNFFGGTWEWDGAQWIKRTSIGPAPRAGHSMAYDSKRKRVVMFGGTKSLFTGDMQRTSETWEWDGIQWTLTTTDGPSVQLSHAMAYDSKRSVVVLFGGDGEGNNETWEWDGTRWTLRTTEGPADRWGHAMAYDSERGAIVLFGGRISNKETSRETWEWGGELWKLRSTKGPSPCSNHSMTYDVKRSVTVLFGGDNNEYDPINEMWEWDGTSWTQLKSNEPARRSGHSIVYDVERDRTLLFGGFGGYGEVKDSVIFGDTWSWDGEHWELLHRGDPPSRIHHATSFDSKRGVTVLFGGQIGFNRLTNEKFFAADTWEFDGTQWTQRQVKGPSARRYHSMVFDSKRGVTVLFGGTSGNTWDNVWNDTWEWDGNKWLLCATEGPSRRALHAMVFDSARGVTVMHGGHGEESVYSKETWEWDGKSWTLRTSDGPHRRKHAMAFDSKRNVTVLYGGENAPENTWEWDGEQWKVASNSSPSELDWRYSHAMAFDESTGVTVLFGGRFGNSLSNEIVGDTWVWDGQFWSPRPESFSYLLTPFQRYGHAMVYDSIRNILVLHGGYWLGDTWTLNLHQDGPEITDQPYILGATACGQIQMSIQAEGTGPLSYQWRNGLQLISNGDRITGSDTSKLTIEPVDLSDEGYYNVVVSNSKCTVQSEPISVRVRECSRDIFPLQGDCEVNVDDLGAIFIAWGPCANCREDLNSDGVVDISDLSRILSAWGPCD